MNPFPSMKAKDLVKLLEKPPLGYRVARQKGSHRTLVSDAGYPKLTVAYHDSRTVGPGEVRRLLVTQVGLAEDEARGLL
jgi:predicted RNA binding protein YcfA (HicA-like mRNA interferase family)